MFVYALIACLLSVDFVVVVFYICFFTVGIFMGFTCGRFFVVDVVVITVSHCYST